MSPLIFLLGLQPPSSTSQFLITRPLERIRRWGTQTLMSVTNMHTCLYSSQELTVTALQIWQHLQPVSNSAANVSAEIKNGHGIVTLRLSFSAEPAALGRKSNASAPDHNGTFSSPSKFSLRGRRPDKEE